MAANNARTDNEVGYSGATFAGLIIGYILFKLTHPIVAPHAQIATVGYIQDAFSSAILGGGVGIEILHCHRWRYTRSWERFFPYIKSFQFLWTFAALLASAFVMAIAQEAIRALGYTMPVSLKDQASVTNQWAGWIGIAGAAPIWRLRVWLSNRRLKHGRNVSAEFREAGAAIVQMLDGLGALLFGSIVLLIGIGLFGAVHEVLSLASSILDLFPDWFRYGGYIGLIVLAILALNFGLRRIVGGLSLLLSSARSDVEDQMAHGEARLASEAEAMSAAKGVAESPIHSLTF